MQLLLQSSPAIDTIFGATIDVIFFFLGAVVLSSLFWYFYQKQEQDKIDKLQKSLDKIKPQHDILQNQHEHLKSEHQKVKQGLADLMENYNTLNVKHEAIISTQGNSQKLNEQADEERQMLLESYESLETNYNDLESRFNRTTATIERLEDELENIGDKKEELEIVNAQLRQKVQKLSDVLEEEGIDVSDIMSDTMEGSNAEDDELERLIGAAKTHHLSSSFDTDIVEEEIIQTQNQDAVNIDLQIKYHQLQKDYQGLQSVNNQLQEQLQTLQIAPNQLVATKPNDEKLEAAYHTLEIDYRALRKEMDDKIMPKLRATQAVLNKKEENYRQLVAKMETQSSQMLSSSNQFKGYEDLKATNQALYGRNKTLSEKNTELEKSYEKLNREYGSLNAQFKLLREQFSLLENKMEQAEQHTSKEEYEQLSKEYTNLKIEFSIATDLQQQQQGKIKELETKLHAINESSGYGIIYLPSNLQIIEGISPKIESILNKANIQNWGDLSNTTTENIQHILDKENQNSSAIEPSAWIQQANLLVNAKWKAFRDLEATLLAGKKQQEETGEFDDLKIIEGIGPKIEVLLNNANIYTWKKLSKTGIGELKRILKEGGTQYATHDPSTWPEQAALAATWNWTRLEELQKELIGGKMPQ